MAFSTICATEYKYCLSQKIRLYVEKNLQPFRETFKITNAFDGATIFTCERRSFSNHYENVLVDDRGVAVLNMKEELLTSDTKAIFAGEGSGRQICKLKSQLTFRTCKLYAEFYDVLSVEIRHNLVLKGDWISKTYTIYLGEPKQAGVPLAHIYRALTADYSVASENDYIIEIAANVDIAICVMMCISLDEYDFETRCQ